MRRARASDLPAVRAVEDASFEAARRASVASLARSFGSPRQSVWVVDAPAGSGLALAAFVILWHHARSVRVYDVAVHPEHRGLGLMRALVAHAEAVARAAGAHRVILEAAEADPSLLERYERLGYARTERLPDYYGEGLHAVRFEKRLDPRVPPG